MLVKIHCNTGDLQGSFDLTGQMVDPITAAAITSPVPFAFVWSAQNRQLASTNTTK